MSHFGMKMDLEIGEVNIAEQSVMSWHVLIFPLTSHDMTLLQNIQIFACSHFAETGNVNIYLPGFEKGPRPQALSGKKPSGKNIIMYLSLYNSALTYDIDSIYSCWNIFLKWIKSNWSQSLLEEKFLIT